MIRFLRDDRGLEQTIGNLLVLMVTLSTISLALMVVTPVIAQYNSRNRIRESEAIMVSLHNEILKVQEEPAGSRRTIELAINNGGIDLLNDPPRMIMYVRVPKEVNVDITDMDFSYTSRGAMFNLDIDLPLVKPAFIGLGSNMVYISKTQDGRLNVTVESFA